MLFAINEVWADPSDTIIKACSNALYRDFCISSLSKAPGALEADLTQLSVIAVNLCIEEAKPVCDFIVDLRERNPNLSALEDCMELLEDTRDRLHDSESELRQLSGANLMEYMSDVQTWLSAVETNQETCVTGLQETQASETMVSTVKVKTDNLTMLISDALAVVNKLGEQGHI
ncbi:hypothetical protein SUGI_0221940 [Cryptomeria japonica]|nr:hypothetical protein SUGI_0221940 [Cryptomeria japonica]